MNSQVAIDGPAASGKTAVGRAVSRTLKWNFLDTGIMYRAATRNVLDLGVSLENDSRIIEYLNFFDLKKKHLSIWMIHRIPKEYL